MSFGSACLSGFFPGNTNRDPFASSFSDLSSAIAQRVSGTACSRLFLLCDAGIVHVPVSKSNSVHSALASSPRRCMVSTSTMRSCLRFFVRQIGSILTTKDQRHLFYCVDPLLCVGRCLCPAMRGSSSRAGALPRAAKISAVFGTGVMLRTYRGIRRCRHDLLEYRGVDRVAGRALLLRRLPSDSYVLSSPPTAAVNPRRPSAFVGGSKGDWDRRPVRRKE